MFMICEFFHMLRFPKKGIQTKLHFNPLYVGFQDLSSQQISCYLTWISLHLSPVYLFFHPEQMTNNPALTAEWMEGSRSACLPLYLSSETLHRVCPFALPAPCGSPCLFLSLHPIPPSFSSLPTLFMNEVYSELGRKSSAFTADKFTFSTLQFKSREVESTHFFYEALWHSGSSHFNFPSWRLLKYKLQVLSMIASGWQDYRCFFIFHVYFVYVCLLLHCKKYIFGCIDRALAVAHGVSLAVLGGDAWAQELWPWPWHVAGGS